MPARRVVLLTHRIAQAAPTGVDRYAVSLAEALAQVSGATMRYQLAVPHEHEVATAVAPDVDVLRIPGPRRALAAAWWLARRPRLERLIGRMDVVHALLPWVPVPTSRPFVITIHDLITFQFPAWYGRLERVLFRAAISQASAAAAVITPSEVVANEVRERLGVPGDRVHTIPLGVGAQFFEAVDSTTVENVCRRYGVAPQGFVLAVGWLSRRKNLVVAARGIAQAGINLPLLVAGPRADDADDVERALGAVGVPVRATGYVADRELRALLGAAAVMVHPSLYEGFGLPPLEAMACGTPVVAADAGALPEVVDGAGLLADPDDPEAWAHALTRVVTDAELNAALRESGRRRARELSWERAARATMAVHEEVLESR